MLEGRARAPRTRRVRPWFFLASLALAGVASCSLGTALDGYSGGAVKGADGSDATPGGEAGLEVGSASEGGTDGGVADADAGVDTRRWCERQAPVPKLCEDFDDPSELAPGWRSETSNTVLTRASADVRSAPYALLVGTSGKSGESAFVRRTYGMPLGKLRAAFDVRVEKRGEYAEIGYIAVHRSAPEATKYFYFQLRGPGYPVRLATPSVLPDGGPSEQKVDLGGNVNFDTWTRVEIEIDYLSDPRTVTVRLDGSFAAAQTLDSSLFVPDSFDLTVGTGYAPGDGREWRILFDNYTADW